MRTEDDDLVHAAAAACLRGAGMLQKEIADTLKITQPAVSRHLKEAEGRGWIKFLDPRFIPPAGEDGHVWEKAQARFFTNRSIQEGLKARFPIGAGRLRRVTVLHGEPEEDRPATAEKELTSAAVYGDGRLRVAEELATAEKELTSAAVHTIRTLLSKVEIVGVTWGRTISRLVRTLGAHIHDAPRGQDPIRFVPLCGEPLKDRFEPIKFSSSALASQFSTIFNGSDRPRPPSLAGVPAFIPKFKMKSGVQVARTRPEVRAIREFLRQVAGYAEVMDDEDSDTGSSEHLVNHLGAILTSVGVVEEEYRGIFLQERVQIGDITESELKECVVGDLGGIIIPKPDLTADQARHIDELNQRWTGIKQRHIVQCAEAADDTRPGVILLALGRRRRSVAMRCIELGLVNELIVDQSLAQALEAALPGSARG